MPRVPPDRRRGPPRGLPRRGAAAAHGLGGREVVGLVRPPQADVHRLPRPGGRRPEAPGVRGRGQRAARGADAARHDGLPQARPHGPRPRRGRPGGGGRQHLLHRRRARQQAAPDRRLGREPPRRRAGSLGLGPHPGPEKPGRRRGLGRGDPPRVAARHERAVLQRGDDRDHRHVWEISRRLGARQVVPLLGRRLRRGDEGAADALGPRRDLRPQPGRLAVRPRELPARGLHGRRPAVRQQSVRHLQCRVQRHGPQPAAPARGRVRRAARHGLQQEEAHELPRQRVRGQPGLRVRVRGRAGGVPGVRAHGPVRVHRGQPHLVRPRHEGAEHGRGHRHGLEHVGALHDGRVRAEEGPGPRGRLRRGPRLRGHVHGALVGQPQRHEVDGLERPLLHLRHGRRRVRARGGLRGRGREGVLQHRGRRACRGQGPAALRLHRWLRPEPQRLQRRHGGAQRPG
mmetsp:Transcript_95401/g.291766  ORF Transcript_95401/g.291766 Transcript_95401/m.291766 type:complete len:457 (-) Transcript_95401:301-1671(-)